METSHPLLNASAQGTPEALPHQAGLRAALLQAKMKMPGFPRQPTELRHPHLLWGTSASPEKSDREGEQSAMLIHGFNATKT